MAGCPVVLNAGVNAASSPGAGERCEGMVRVLRHLAQPRGRSGQRRRQQEVPRRRRARRVPPLLHPAPVPAHGGQALEVVVGRDRRRPLGQRPRERLDVLGPQLPVQPLPGHPHAAAGVGRPQRREPGDEVLVLQAVGVGLLHVVAERRQQGGRLLGRADARGMGRHPRAGSTRTPTRRRPGSAPTSARYGRSGRRGDDGVADARAARGVEQRGRVTHGAGDDVLDAEAALVPQRPEGGPPLADLEPDQPAAGGRDADGAAAVAGVRGRHQPRRDRGGRPAARTARRALQVPRVVGRAEGHGLGRREDAELGRVRPAQDHEPGGAVATDQGGVDGRPASPLAPAR